MSTDLVDTYDHSSDWILIQSEDDSYSVQEEYQEDLVDGYDSSDWIILIHEEDDDTDAEANEYDSYSDPDEAEEEYDYDEILLEGYDQREKGKERSVLMELIKHQVLPLLPAKSLLRFKSTSRQWNCYISSPLFIHTHSLLSRSVTGLFFRSPAGSPSFASFDRDPNPLPDPTLSFLPEPVLVKSSTGGLLCCLGRQTTNYYICNPITTEWTILPPPINHHGPDPSVVIVMQEPSSFNFFADYYVVCSYELFEGVYAFETFSSASREWRQSKEIAAAERLVSGVSAGGCAYWRTTMQLIVAYNPETDALWTTARPAGDATWEIGELGRRLCYVSVSGVMVLEDGSEGKWRKVREFTIEEEEDMVPLRTQGEREVVLWEGQSRLVVARDVVDGGKRMLVDSAAPGYCADFLPYVSSLVHVQGYVSS